MHLEYLLLAFELYSKIYYIYYLFSLIFYSGNSRCFGLISEIYYC